MCHWPQSSQASTWPPRAAVRQCSIADLDDPDVGAVLQQVGGEAVTQRVRPDPLGDVGGLCCLDDHAIELAGADGLHRMLPREQPAVAMHHALLTSDLPPLTQKREPVLREHGVAIAPALATLDAQQHALAVDVGNLQHRNLGDTQARAIGNRQCGLVLEAGGGVEQPGHLVATEHHGQVARMRQPDKPARQVRAVERLVKKKRSADTMLFIVGTGTPSACCSIWNRRRSSAVAVSGERPRNVARRPMSRR